MTAVAMRTPTFNVRQYWRIPVAALIGAVLGFGTSYLFGVSYAATTRVLIRVNNTTLLGSNGSTLTNQGATVEQSAVSKTVAETEGALLGNDVIATKLVRKLHLDKPEKKGFFSAPKAAFATTFKFGVSILVHGTYKKLPRFEQAVKDTQKGLSATQVGNSYMLDVTGKWKTPAKAKAIANAAADYLVAAGEQRFRDDVAGNTKHLAQQVTLAGEQERQAAAGLATFAQANGISTATLGAALTPELALTLPPAVQANYQQLQQKYNTSLAAFTQLQVQLQQGQVNGGIDPVELTRVDKAVATVYPVSPKRWLWMGIGIVLGALIGFFLTAREAWRRGETLFPRDDDFPLPRDDDFPRDDDIPEASAEPQGTAVTRPWPAIERP
jgi:uncharacterized protein involved in exopolysaccharide biosynthesis